MYEATEEELYKDAIVKYMDACVDAEGNLNADLEQENELEFAVAGNLLYFMYQQTGDEKYHKAIEAMMKRVKLCVM